jgi:hypothetical protein
MSEPMFGSLDPSDDAKSATSSKDTTWALAVFAVLALTYWILYLFDDTTVLWPSHDASLRACFWIAGLSGLAVCVLLILGMFRSKVISVWRRIAAALGFAVATAIFVFLVTVRVVDIVNGWLDFPSSKTKTFTGLIQISRAYHTHGKGASANIQTMPIWSNMDVAEDDYQFMLKNRRAGDTSHNPDEVSSKGYFCAKVTLQQSGNALRVLHAGSHELPAGTVILCPASLPQVNESDALRN